MSNYKKLYVRVFVKDFHVYDFFFEILNCPAQKYLEFHSVVYNNYHWGGLFIIENSETIKIFTESASNNISVNYFTILEFYGSIL